MCSHLHKVEEERHLVGEMSFTHAEFFLFARTQRTVATVFIEAYFFRIAIRQTMWLEPGSSAWLARQLMSPIRKHFKFFKQIPYKYSSHQS